jgi:hypothetical protein
LFSLRFYQKHKMSNYLIGQGSPIKLILRQRVFDNLLRPKNRLCIRNSILQWKSVRIAFTAEPEIL